MKTIKTFLTNHKCAPGSSFRRQEDGSFSPIQPIQTDLTRDQRRAGNGLPTSARTVSIPPLLAGSRPAVLASGAARAIRVSLVAAVVALIVFFGGPLMALEKPDYEVLEDQGVFELRQYAPYIVAETHVDSDFADAGNEGFRRLADYIFGNNRSRQMLDMTAPVSQSASEKIAMTAPVNMHREGQQYRVTFMMPTAYSLETLPAPVSPQVRLRQVSPEQVAAIRYSGTWSQRRFDQHQALLEEWVADRGWEITGEPIFARYDPPFIPWFLRRNEVLLPVEVSPTRPEEATAP